MQIHLKIMSELLFFKFTIDQLINFLFQSSNFVIGYAFISHQFE